MQINLQKAKYLGLLDFKSVRLNRAKKPPKAAVRLDLYKPDGQKYSIYLHANYGYVDDWGIEAIEYNINQ